jgi:hypothetical protein
MSKQATDSKFGRILPIIALSGGAVILLLLLVPAFSRIGHRRGPEVVALDNLRTLHNAQVEFKRTTGRYGTLKELADAEMIGVSHASGKPVNKYHYWVSDVTAETYCVHADRVRDDSGSRDFNISEDGVIYFIQSPHRGSVARRAGIPLDTVVP